MNNETTDPTGPLGEGACFFPECTEPLFAQRLCGGHYNQWRLKGKLVPLLKRTQRNPQCIMEGCATPVWARGLCTKHYAADRAADSTTPPPWRSKCSFEDCGRDANSGGLCGSHVYQKVNQGYLTALRPQNATLEQAFRFGIIKTEHGWEWRTASGGSKSGKPGKYGVFSHQGKSWYAHRAAWTIKNGPIPEGMEVDHDPGCPKTCVTMKHLTLRTKREHAIVGWERGELDGGWSVRERAPQERAPQGSAPVSRPWRKPYPRVEHVPASVWKVEKACGFCGNSYIPNNIVQRYCSLLCNSRMKGKKESIEKALARGTRACRGCGEMFNPLRRDALSCSRECGVNYQNRTKAKRKLDALGGKEAILAPRPCLWCKEDFVPTNLTIAARQKFCSQSCGSMDYYHSHKEGS